jgi:ribulose 1,5-bisphosphate synthetase/thiazole synthase
MPILIRRIPMISHSSDSKLSSNKKVIIVGAGPGGLSAGMLLASKGYSVDIYEKEDKTGEGTPFSNLVIIHLILALPF